ncbi:hypothetical protein ACFYRN_25125 [Streptomyces sp. NPDC005227]|uniref:hypothetical protein n=1 Tax=Streptomyces sp. NPDC005227 TaxID=3364707 RepID=UPI0036B46DD4
MTDRRVIDCQALMEQTYRTPGLLQLVQQWFRSNGIEPRDVPVHSEVVIEDSAFGLVIRYEAYLSNAQGCKYVDPEHPDQAAMAARTAVLLAAPPAAWLTGGETP